MEKLSVVRFVDAYSYNDEQIQDTELPVHRAFGWAEKRDQMVVVRFIKGVSSEVDNPGNLVQGLIIPKTNLVSESKKFDHNLFDGLRAFSKISIKWSDVVFVDNTKLPNPSIMITEGILEKNEEDRLVLKNSKTTRMQPLPERRHHNSDEKYWIIPKSVVLEVKEVK